MNHPTLRTLARLLAPWHTIRRLVAKNQRLRRSNDRLVDMVLLACSRNVASDRRLRHCPTHGQQPDNAWGCPDCVRELRQEAEQLRAERDAAQDAVRRLMRWHVIGYDTEVVRGVYLWATRDGMAGPLPPLPEWLITRLQGDPEARC
jgi:hypothetical protein